MANVNTKKGTIGILTGGGDVPGLNPAIRGVTRRALSQGYQVIGLRRGWAGIIEMVREKDYDNSDNFQILTKQIVEKAGRTGGTFLHSSRTNPSRVGKLADAAGIGAGRMKKRATGAAGFLHDLLGQDLKIVRIVVVFFAHHLDNAGPPAPQADDLVALRERTARHAANRRI